MKFILVIFLLSPLCLYADTIESLKNKVNMLEVRVQKLESMMLNKTSNGLKVQDMGNKTIDSMPSTSTPTISSEKQAEMMKMLNEFKKRQKEQLKMLEELDREDP